VSFGPTYSRIYDGLYESKDYADEVRFVLNRSGKVTQTQDAPTALDILDLGCGTGRHAVQFASIGHRVHGIDLSSQMLDVAVERAKQLNPYVRNRVSFSQGDIRDFSISHQFDAAYCLFHVMSYLHNDQDIVMALSNVRSHLKTGGVFLFDFWNGDAVLDDPPKKRERITEIGLKRVHRVSVPTWSRERSVVTIDYEIEVDDLMTGIRDISHETHILRYFFPDEVSQWLRSAEFSLLEMGEWMTARPPTKQSFSTYALAFVQ
jgi:SAM-dependent methyltransferase